MEDRLLDISAQGLRLTQQRNQPSSDEPTLPAPAALRAAETTLPVPGTSSYLAGCAQEDTVRHIVEDIIPALNGQGLSSRYFGFVTGGVLPIAEWADNVVSRMDQNVQVHLPGQTISTTVEHVALEMTAGLLRLGDGAWMGRTFTTGATASNVLGLACGREHVLNRRLGGEDTVGELGVLAACLKAGVSEIQVLTSGAHSSLSKAASVVGLGRGSVKELRRSADKPWELDLGALEAALRKPGVASLIAVSAGEVNSGGFALKDVAEWGKVRELADKYGAWIHVDGAFGVFARALDEREAYKTLRERVEGLTLADSITVDGHKLLNVPYDCGMFFTRSPAIMQSVFTNPNAAYLSAGAPSSIPSPLNIGLENSRRFRALPAYAVLHSEGRTGFATLLSNMVQLARNVASFVRDSEHYLLLPEGEASVDDDIFMTVLFRAKDAALNQVLVDKINQTRQLYVSGTSWAGEKAVRLAVSNWKVDAEKDFKVVASILTAVAEGREFSIDNV
ncbi:pyridoxal phosphate-dependent transferase [Stachybotrys elegans]|uniref:Pyridoxal phosphate-dependent transferase n=1 Tax=Stachybotrys elegans TaxID=80388 RepID=A0A8K0WVE3_9HYPO|nr:pyridoxal phosphate-dependent transferase [Stachybotrys elegans]